jgi:hypothetical protein
MTKGSEPEAGKSEEYQRFEALTKALIAVPKPEIDTAVKRDKAKKARAKKAPRPATSQ